MICGDSQLSQYSNNPTWTAQGYAAVDLYKLIHFQCRRHLKSFKTKALARVKQLNNDVEPEINIEQQIQILDVPDTVRRRAMDR